MSWLECSAFLLCVAIMVAVQPMANEPADERAFRLGSSAVAAAVSAAVALWALL
jgi:hypothetical protein